MSDPRKEAIYREKIMTARPVRQAVCGLVPLWELAKVIDVSNISSVWSCACASAYMRVHGDEAHCRVQDLVDEVVKWKAADMFNRPTIILLDIILDTLATTKMETVIFERESNE